MTETLMATIVGNEENFTEMGDKTLCADVLPIAAQLRRSLDQERDLFGAEHILLDQIALVLIVAGLILRDGCTVASLGPEHRIATGRHALLSLEAGRVFVVVGELLG